MVSGRGRVFGESGVGRRELSGCGCVGRGKGRESHRRRGREGSPSREM